MSAPSTHLTCYGFQVSVEIVRDADTNTAYIEVLAPCYVNKHWWMPHSYTASQFSDGQILRDHDFIRVMSQHFPAK